jgi:ADP-heptose:LPS heptosyltransferase
MVSPAGFQAAPLLPWIDQVLATRVLWQDLGNLPFNPDREWLLMQNLRQRNFDGVIILTSFSQSPFPAGLACLLAGIPLRAASSKERGSGTFTTLCGSPPDHIHQVDRSLYLIRALGFNAPDTSLQVEIKEQDRAAARGLLSSRGVAGDEPYLLANPWASAKARTYPEDLFARATLDLTKRSGMRVVVTGSPGDRERSSEILSVLGSSAVNLVGQTTVPQLTALVEHATLALTNDTSVMHLADAVNTPEIVLYSGTELESQWRPRRTRHILLRRPTSCSPCYAFDCPRNLECLDIPPQEVAAAGMELLSGL